MAERPEDDADIEKRMTKMSGDLFAPSFAGEHLRVEGAEIEYFRDFLSVAVRDATMAELIRCVPWGAEKLVVWGKEFDQPRLIAWYGDSEKRYTYSGIKLEPLPWTSLLLDVRRRVQTITKNTFNSVLLNYYRDNRDSMGMHSDDERELGIRPVIASISIGEKRTFVMKHKRRLDLKPVRLPLESGSLLLMKGDTQRNWKHGIEKEKRPCGPRINLTFRSIVC